MRILVVEDEPLLRAQLVGAIAAAGHTVEQADDGVQAQYLAKPFHMEELLARLRALLRRRGEHASAQWQCGPIWLDTRQARVLVDGQPLVLTSHEFKLLSLLMQRKGEVLSRTELSEHLYPQDSDRDSNTIEVFVGRLRKKLPAGSIETVRGLGYRLLCTDSA
jgi:two-component system OmpR family response regulator